MVLEIGVLGPSRRDRPLWRRNFVSVCFKRIPLIKLLDCGSFIVTLESWWIHLGREGDGGVGLDR